MQRLLAPRVTAPQLTVEVLEGLDAFVHTERFLHKLQEARKELDEADAEHTSHLQQLAAAHRNDSVPVVSTDVTPEDFVNCSAQPAGLQELPPAAGAASATAAPNSSSSSDGFVVVQQQDAVEGMAYYIALYISSMPEAKQMEPRQLQSALKEAFKLVRRSKFRLVWDWGRWLYRWSALSYGLVSLYDNPWLMRALLTGIWTAAKAARFAFGHML